MKACVAICIYCGKFPNRKNASKEHIPSKSLLDPERVKDHPTVVVCKTCNEGFAKDEEYVAALLASVIDGSTNPGPKRFPGAAKTLAHSSRLQRRIGRTRREQFSIFGGSEIL